MEDLLNSIGALAEVQTVAYKSFRNQGLTFMESALNAAVLIDILLKNNGGRENG